MGVGVVDPETVSHRPPPFASRRLFRQRRRSLNASMAPQTGCGKRTRDARPPAGPIFGAADLACGRAYRRVRNKFVTLRPSGAAVCGCAQPSPPQRDGDRPLANDIKRVAGCERRDKPD